MSRHLIPTHPTCPPTAIQATADYPARHNTTRTVTGRLTDTHQPHATHRRATSLPGSARPIASPIDIPNRSNAALADPTTRVITAHHGSTHATTRATAHLPWPEASPTTRAASNPAPTPHADYPYLNVTSHRPATSHHLPTHHAPGVPTSRTVPSPADKPPTRAAT